MRKEQVVLLGVCLAACLVAVASGANYASVIEEEEEEVEQIDLDEKFDLDDFLQDEPFEIQENYGIDWIDDF